MFCHKCGTKVEADARFCKKCGQAISEPLPEDKTTSPLSLTGSAIWNPNATANWSLLLSPAFGSYLQALNWKALGEHEKASAIRGWFYVSLALLLAYPILDLLTLDSTHNPAKGIAFLYLIIWYFAIGRSQAKYVKEKFGTGYARRSWGAPLLVGVTALIVYVLLSVALGTIVGTSIGLSAAKRQVEKDAVAMQVPPGLLGTRWLMSQSEVQRARPNAASAEQNTLAESTFAFGRAADVEYHFQNDLLVLIVVTFKPPSSQSAFQTMQHTLNTEYGGLPEPTSTQDHVLVSEKTVGRFAIQHSLAEYNRVLVEQVIIYRTKEKP